MIAILLIIIASVELAWAAVVLRADPRRFDNQVFAGIAATDTVMALVRAVYILQGHTISDFLLALPCGVLSMFLANLTVEFAWSFPLNRPAPLRVRVPVMVYSAVSAALLVGRPQWFMPFVSFVYFLPMFALTTLLLARNLRRLDGRQRVAVRLVMAAVIFRWCFAMAAYAVARNIGPHAFAATLTAEATISVLGASVLIGYAVVSGQLFSVRGLMAEMIVHATLALTVAASVVGGIELLLDRSPGPIALRFGLLAISLLPVAILLAVRKLRGRMEARLDPRRAARNTIVKRILESAKGADVSKLVLDTCGAFAEVSAGGKVQFLSGPGRRVGGAAGELDAELAARLSSEGHVVGEGTLHVAVRAGDELHGALQLTGGHIDRDTLLASEALAGHLAVKLENLALFAELEDSRTLATLGSFAAAIAHDIRTPLTSISMNVQMLRRKVSLPPDDMEHFDIALEELGRLNASISELLDYAKPVKLRESRLELRDVADDAAAVIAPIYAERGVALAVELPDDVSVLADAGRLRQVLLNLLDNAAKASARGTRVHLRCASSDDGRVAVEIADEGKGIEPGELVRIFEPFYTTRPDGTGLGLAIVQKLVRAHRGEVTVRSTPGKGSVFTLLLPAG